MTTRQQLDDLCRSARHGRGTFNRKGISMTQEEFLTRKCDVCGDRYPLNSPRVVRAFRNSQTPLEKETPKLCWVCTRLFHSNQQAFDFSELRQILDGKAVSR